MSTHTIPCPVCTHEETDRARRYERERCDDDMANMYWSPPSKRAGGCGIERGDIEACGRAIPAACA